MIARLHEIENVFIDGRRLSEHVERRRWQLEAQSEALQLAGVQVDERRQEWFARAKDKSIVDDGVPFQRIAHGRCIDHSTRSELDDGMGARTQSTSIVFEHEILHVDKRRSDLLMTNEQIPVLDLRFDRFEKRTLSLELVQMDDAIFGNRIRIKRSQIEKLQYFGVFRCKVIAIRNDRLDAREKFFLNRASKRRAEQRIRPRQDLIRVARFEFPNVQAQKPPFIAQSPHVGRSNIAHKGAQDMRAQKGMCRFEPFHGLRNAFITIFNAPIRAKRRADDRKRRPCEHRRRPSRQHRRMDRWKIAKNRRFFGQFQSFRNFRRLRIDYRIVYFDTPDTRMRPLRIDDGNGNRRRSMHVARKWIAQLDGTLKRRRRPLFILHTRRSTAIPRHSCVV